MRHVVFEQIMNFIFSFFTYKTIVLQNYNKKIEFWFNKVLVIENKSVNYKGTIKIQLQHRGANSLMKNTVVSHGHCL